MKYKNILYIFIIVAMVVFLGCDEDKVIPKKNIDIINLETQPDQISYKTEVTFVDSNFTKAILKAERARVYQSRMETLLDGGVYVQFFKRYSTGKVSYLTSDSARIDDRTKNMMAGGHVVVISDSTNTKLETSLLEWDNITQKLYSTEFVRVTSPSETIQGYGFESDQSLSNYKIFRVSGQQKGK
ncbi:LPS export ABC transporter periplasmic protein LptC [Bacteroidetes/Chlorobi group bacterium ChocPot_Mid]|jgi:LPS export ABC transporter protein LptC|nr:MAG: LPS export ABC transporter periplasmic protein LptC [Bacteroidetes/Chlorobi group bacterium ChocPot_Mid]